MPFERGHRPAPIRIPPFALRASQAAAALGISESQLRQWIEDGVVHRPYRVRPHIVLFDAIELAQHWERIKGTAFERPASNTASGRNPWDEVLEEAAAR
jgi:hypothetical protein